MRWVLEPNPDFEAVCSLASIDPDAVRAKVTGGGLKVREKPL